MMQSKLIPIAETTKENMAIFLKSESEVEDAVERKWMLDLLISRIIGQICMQTILLVEL